MDTVLLTEQLAGAEAVVHCAALVSYDSRHEAQMHKVNVEGTANLVNASLRLGIDHFLHVSSVAAIGRGKDQARIDETHQANAEEFGTAYARSKHLAELEVWRASSEGLPVAIVNPSLVLGPGEWDQSSTKIFKYIWDENRFYVRWVGQLRGRARCGYRGAASAQGAYHGRALYHQRGQRFVR